MRRFTHQMRVIATESGMLVREALGLRRSAKDDFRQLADATLVGVRPHRTPGRLLRELLGLPAARPRPDASTGEVVDLERAWRRRQTARELRRIGVVSAVCLLVLGAASYLRFGRGVYADLPEITEMLPFLATAEEKSPKRAPGPRFRPSNVRKVAKPMPRYEDAAH